MNDLISQLRTLSRSLGSAAGVTVGRAADELERLRAELAQHGEPVATLHDDGCFTWKRDEFRHKYDRQRAGWRMDVYAAPPQRQPLSEEELFNIAKMVVCDDDLAAAIKLGRAVERAHGIMEKS